MPQLSQLPDADFPVKVYAEAVVRSRSGMSLLDAAHPITSQTVTQFYASLDQLQETAERLRSAGFEVLDVGTQSISIAAPPEVFERTFQTTLEVVERPVIKELGQTTTASFLNAIDNKPFGEVDVSHTSWDTLLDGVVLNEPIYYHRGAAPVATPPATPNHDYLPVPDGVAELLNALNAHRQGITGKGVHVVMVDSGWYNHPFFQSRHHHAKVVLAPGSTDATQDDNGHGTGESANLFAIAPEVQLTVVKADVALAKSVRNVNSVSALRTAIALQPDIISCSWGSDQRRRELSPYNRLLAALVADAVHQGIIVVCSAGNGQFSFPAQHPDAIAAGGVYVHLKGSLKGKLEASNYASSFVSPVYPNRRVPDLCGLVGNLPYASYLLLPVPPGSEVDQRLASTPDGTEAADGWAAFSGTSAAAPQIAGICALIKQVRPDLSPAQVKDILKQTARDVLEGFSNPSSSGAIARAGPDLPTGYGLADVLQAIQYLQQRLGVKLPPLPPFPIPPPHPLSSSPAATPCCDLCPPPPNTHHSTSQPALTRPTHPASQSTSPRRKTMASEFPKLQKHLDELLWKIEKEIQNLIENNGIEEVELDISILNFMPRSAITKVSYSLRDSLNVTFDKNSGKMILDPSKKITKEHISAAQGLLKIGRYQETAIFVLSQVLLIKEEGEPGDIKEIKKIKKRAAKALSQCSTEIVSFDSNSRVSTNSLLTCRDYDKEECAEMGKQYPCGTKPFTGR